MNRTKLLKTGAFALIASALAFSAYNGYKYLKAEKERREKEDMEIALEMENREVAKVVEDILKREEDRKEAMEEWMQDCAEVDEEREQLELMLESQQDPPVDEEYVEEEREVEEVRHDPNSVTALEQFKEMRMADIKDPGLKSLIRQLFEVPFVPIGEDDETIGMHIDDERIEFFGDGRWVGERTFADLIMYFAYLMNFDFDKSIQEGTALIIKNLDIRPLDTHSNLVNIMERIQAHDYETRHGWGMFGLPDRYDTFMKEYWNYMAPEMEIAEALEDDENGI